MKLIRTSLKLVILTKNMENYDSKSTSESTPLNKLAVADAAWARMPVDSLNMTLALMKSYKSAKEWRLYIKFETNHTIWTNTKPLTVKIFLCTIFCRINEAFWERVHCQYLETFRDWQVRV